MCDDGYDVERKMDVSQYNVHEKDEMNKITISSLM